MYPLGLVEPDVTAVLGANPDPLHKLVYDLFDSDADIADAANDIYARCFSANRDRFFLKLTLMATISNLDNEFALEILNSSLTHEYRHWDYVDAATKYTIKQLLLGCVACVIPEQNMSNLFLFGSIIGMIASAPVRVGPQRTRTESWDDLLLCVIEYLHFHSNKLQMFSLNVIEKAPDFVSDMLNTDHLGKAERLSDRLADFLTSDDRDLLYAAVRTTIALWVASSDVHKALIKKNMSLICNALPLVVYYYGWDPRVLDLLMKLNHHIKFESITLPSLDAMAECLLMIGESDLTEYNIKCKAIDLVINLIQFMSNSFDELSLNVYISRFLNSTMCLMSEIEDFESTDSVQPKSNYGRFACRQIIYVIGAIKIVYRCHGVIDSFMDPSEVWRKRHASITTVGQLSLQIPHEMPEVHMEKVMNWISRSLDDGDEKVIWATGDAIKRLVPWVRGCHENPIPHREKLLMNLLHCESRTLNPSVKHCLEEAY